MVKQCIFPCGKHPLLPSTDSDLLLYEHAHWTLEFHPWMFPWIAINTSVDLARRFNRCYYFIAQRSLFPSLLQNHFLNQPVMWIQQIWLSVSVCAMCAFHPIQLSRLWGWTEVATMMMMICLQDQPECISPTLELERKADHHERRFSLTCQIWVQICLILHFFRVDIYLGPALASCCAIPTLNFRQI